MSKLATWANGRSRSGKAEFKSQAALQSYLQKHPGADKSKHSVAGVAKPSAGPSRGEQYRAGLREQRTQAQHTERMRGLMSTGAVQERRVPGGVTHSFTPPRTRNLPGRPPPIRTPPPSREALAASRTIRLRFPRS